MADLGNVLGGLAQARGEREERERLSRGVDIQERGISLAERQFGFQQEQAKATTKRSAADEAVENFEFVIDKVEERMAGPNPLGPQEQEGIRASFAQAGEEGLDPEIVSQLTQRLDLALGVATPKQTAVAAGEAKLTTAETIAGELDPAQRAILAGVPDDPTGIRQMQSERDDFLGQASVADAQGRTWKLTYLEK